MANTHTTLVSLFEDIADSLRTKGVTRLPTEYQEVEYIESTGTQYIDTGYTRKFASTIFSMDYYTTNYAGDKQAACLFGDENSTSDRFVVRYNYSKLIYYSQAGGAKDISGTVSGDNHLEVDFINKEITINGTVNTMQGYDNPSGGHSVILFAQYYMGRVVEFGAYRLYGFKVYETSIVHNFVPCYRKSDNEVGMYDTVTKTFFVNNGTGTFLKGADVNKIVADDFPSAIDAITLNTLLPSGLKAVDLGSLTWNHNGLLRDGIVEFYSGSLMDKEIGVYNLLTERFGTENVIKNNTIQGRNNSVGITVRTSDYGTKATATTFKQAMQGVVLIYKTAEESTVNTTSNNIEL